MLDNGKTRKELGIKITDDAHKHQLNEVRNEAVQLAKARPDRTISIAEVDMAYQAKGIDLFELLGNATGAIFRNKKRWEAVKYVRKTVRPRSHHNIIIVWKYIGV